MWFAITKLWTTNRPNLWGWGKSGNRHMFMGRPQDDMLKHLNKNANVLGFSADTIYDCKLKFVMLFFN